MRRNLAEVCAQHGVTFDRLRDLVAEAHDAYVADQADVVLDQAAATAVARLYYLHLFRADQVAVMTGIPVELVEDAIERSPRTHLVREVITLHLDGLTPVQIAEHTGVRRSHIYRWLEDAGHTPHTKNMTLPDVFVDLAAQLYRKGSSYAAIALALSVSESQVSVLLRRANRNGLLPEYGTNWAVRS